MTPSQIINAVCQVFPVTPEDITGPRRRRNEAEARHCAAHFMWDLRMSNAEVGRHLGGRDHTAIIGSRQRFNDLYATDKKYRAMADKVAAILGVQVVAA